jgi:hypothetical protein
MAVFFSRSAKKYTPEPTTKLKKYDINATVERLCFMRYALFLEIKHSVQKRAFLEDF